MPFHWYSQAHDVSWGLSEWPSYIFGFEFDFGFGSKCESERLFPSVKNGREIISPELLILSILCCKKS